MKEKRIKNVVERKCIYCGKVWKVVQRPNNKNTSKRVFCDECSKTLPKDLKQRLYRENSGEYHYEERTCINCGNVWTVQVKNSYHAGRTKHFCAECASLLSNKEKKQKQREMIAGFHEKEKEQRRASHKRTVAHNLWKRAFDRAKKYNYPFDITVDDIIIPDKCPILEVPFILGSKGNYEYTPSLDRKINSLGYVKGNIQVISKKANSMKNSATPEELKAFCKNVLRYSLSNSEKETVELQDKEPVG